MSKKPLLSIGMIVKNEIRCLEKCFTALQPLRDAISCELVVADTGSTDGTRELAEKYADIFFDFEWVNDFAAARNAVLKRCSGKWYFSVDADEYLRPEIQPLVDFLSGPQSSKQDLACITVRNHTTPSMNGDYADLAAIRLARRTPKLCYWGAIHEVFNFKENSIAADLGGIILDHDGYADVAKGYLEKKGKRNMFLLEQELTKNPDDLRRLCQCLESCVNLPEKRTQFMHLGMQEIMKEDRAPRWEVWAPIIARKAVELTWYYGGGDIDQWSLWARKNFPNSLYVRIDVGFCYFNYLMNSSRYDEAIAIGFEYLQGIAQYKKVGSAYSEVQFSPVLKASRENENFVRLKLAHILQQERRDKEALEILDDVRMKAADHATILDWLREVDGNTYTLECADMVAERLGTLFVEERLSDEEKHTRQLVREHVAQKFATPINGQWKCYRKLTKNFALCASILEAQDKAELSALLASISDWTEILPMPLAHAIEFGTELPESFYHMSVGHLHSLIDMLAKTCPTALVQYAAPEYITNWHRLCFAYDILCALCMHGGTNIYTDRFADRFAQVCNEFLKEYYNPKVLTNETAVDRLPALHRFTWHYARADELRRKDDWTGYVTELRKALGEAEVMKPFVQYLLNDVQARRKREEIANASPELIALAGQVKAILATYPADDPAVAALKTTPAYQQVAFLIEE